MSKGARQRPISLRVKLKYHTELQKNTQINCSTKPEQTSTNQTLKVTATCLYFYSANCTF